MAGRHEHRKERIVPYDRKETTRTTPLPDHLQNGTVPTSLEAGPQPGTMKEEEREALYLAKAKSEQDLHRRHAREDHLGGTKDSRRSRRQEGEYQRIHCKLDQLEQKVLRLDVGLAQLHRERREWLEKEHAKAERTKKKDIQDKLKLFIARAPELPADLEPVHQNPYSPRSQVYYVSEVVKFYRHEHSLIRQHLRMSMEMIRMFERKLPDPDKPKPRKLCPRKTIVFDLDETLVHCNENLEKPRDFALKMRFPTGEEMEVGINVRPHVQEFLAALAPHFELMLFTASHSFYANAVLERLDPDGSLFPQRFFRESCFQTPEGAYVKDLRILNRDPADVVLVDNAAYSYAFQLDNGIPILPYYEGNEDFELPALQQYLSELASVADVRETNRRVFQLHRYSEFATIEALVETLYSPQLFQ